MMDQALFKEFAGIFSLSRLNSYLNHHVCQNPLDAICLYCRNIQLSQALYPSLQVFEVVLRNTLHTAIADLCDTNFWFDETFLFPKERLMIEQVKHNLKRQNKVINADRLVAELSLGFWTSLFDVRYEHNQTLWPRLLHPVFPKIPKQYKTRQHLSRELNRIRYLRNRIFHFEPIWHWHDLFQQYQTLLTLIGWISPLAIHYLSALDHFDEIYHQEFEKDKEKIYVLFGEQSKPIAESLIEV